jgi:hypothetical protein
MSYAEEFTIINQIILLGYLGAFVGLLIMLATFAPPAPRERSEHGMEEQDDGLR